MSRFLHDMIFIFPKVKTFSLSLMLTAIGSTYANAQIGYQIALINNATGEPRAMETVTVDLEITNKEGVTIYSGSQRATTNDFGILSLSVGETNTFKDADWGKLPFFISAKVDGILIGKSQILSVPVAEYAKTTGVLTNEILCSQTWSFSNSRYDFSFSFNKNGTGIYNYTLFSDGKIDRKGSYPLNYYIQGNIVTAIAETDSYTLIYIPETNSLSVSESRIYK